MTHSTPASPDPPAVPDFAPIILDTAVDLTETPKPSPVKPRRRSRQCHLPRNSISGPFDLSTLIEPQTKSDNYAHAKAPKLKNTSNINENAIKARKGALSTQHLFSQPSLSLPGVVNIDEGFKSAKKITPIDIAQPLTPAEPELFSPAPTRIQPPLRESMIYKAGDDQRPYSIGRDWKTSIWHWLWPIDKCLMSACCPCILFGQTEALYENVGYDRDGIADIKCLTYVGSCCICFAWPSSMRQRNNVRRQHNLEGSALSDCLLSFWCGPCSAVQVNKESLILYQPPRDYHCSCFNDHKRCSGNWTPVDLGRKKNLRRVRDLAKWHEDHGQDPYTVPEFTIITLLEVLRDYGIVEENAREEFNKHKRYIQGLNFIQFLQIGLHEDDNPLPKSAREFWDTYHEAGTVMASSTTEDCPRNEALPGLANFSFSTGGRLLPPDTIRKSSCDCSACVLCRNVLLSNTESQSYLTTPKVTPDCGCAGGQLCTCVSCECEASVAGTSALPRRPNEGCCSNQYCVSPPFSCNVPHKKSTVDGDPEDYTVSKITNADIDFVGLGSWRQKGLKSFGDTEANGSEYRGRKNRTSRIFDAPPSTAVSWKAASFDAATLASELQDLSDRRHTSQKREFISNKAIEGENATRTDAKHPKSLWSHLFSFKAAGESADRLKAKSQSLPLGNTAIKDFGYDTDLSPVRRSSDDCRCKATHVTESFLAPNEIDSKDCTCAAGCDCGTLKKADGLVKTSDEEEIGRVFRRGPTIDTNLQGSGSGRGQGGNATHGIPVILSPTVYKARKLGCGEPTCIDVCEYCEG